MARREDGKETRSRLLNAACEVFAEKGYRNAKIADICRRANANVAAVNYYFGDKATLYSEAWHQAFEKCAFPESNRAAYASPEEALRSYIYSLMENFTAQDDRGQFTRLYLMELANPTGVIQDTWHELIEPRRQRLLGIIREILGSQSSEETVIFCEMSIINQCRALSTIRRTDMEFLLGKHLSPDIINRLADHFTRFSLAGIKAVALRET